MPAERLTLAKLERELRQAFASNATLRTAAFRTHSAEVDFDATSADIAVDNFRVGLLPGVLHECLHFCRNAQLQGWGALEEVVTEAVEAAMEAYVNRSAARVKRWRKLIGEALEAGDE